MAHYNKYRKTGFVYLFSATDSAGNKIYKLGSTSNIECRLSQINRSNPYNLTFSVVSYVPTQRKLRDEERFKWALFAFVKRDGLNFVPTSQYEYFETVVSENYLCTLLEGVVNAKNFK